MSDFNKFNRHPLPPDIEAELYGAIRALPINRKWTCLECDAENEVSSMAVYSKCAQCGWQCKHRSFSGSTDLQDIMLIVLQWFADAGVQLPEELGSLVDNDWSDTDEFYSDMAD